MNGEAVGGEAGGGGRVVTSQPSYLRTGSTPPVYSSSPRLRRLDDMKKSYMSAGGGVAGGVGVSSSAATPATYNSTYASKYSGGAGNSYRLASLDRLAQRHKLYDATGAAPPPDANGGVAVDGGGGGGGGGRDTPQEITSTVTASSTVQDSSAPLVSVCVCMHVCVCIYVCGHCIYENVITVLSFLPLSPGLPASLQSNLGLPRLAWEGREGGRRERDCQT